MANLEETHEAELDAILGELNLLEQRANTTNANATNNDSNIPVNNIQNNQTTNALAQVTMVNGRNRRTHSRSNSIISGVTSTSISTSSESGNGSGSDSSGTTRESRTESPDNDSAFSDTVSLLSSESSASSGVSTTTGNATIGKNLLAINSNLLQVNIFHSKCYEPLFGIEVSLRDLTLFHCSVIVQKQQKFIWHYKNWSKHQFDVCL